MRLATALLLSVCAASCDIGFTVDGNNGADGGSAQIGDPQTTAGEPLTLAGITDAHNQVRTAKGIASLLWDSDLAAVAQKWASECTWNHNPDRSASYPGYVGENLYGSGATPTASGVVGSWASEEQYYDYSTNSCATGQACGHYTQVVWAETQRVGCAVQNCPNLQIPNIVVCNYSPGGNFAGQLPY